MLLDSLDKNKNLYIGGHGDYRMIGEENVYYHSGGPGFIITNNALGTIYSDLYTMHNNWINICKNTNNNRLIPACDVQISYFLQKKNVEVIKNKHFYSCNFIGCKYNYRYKCCYNTIDTQNIIACHEMSPTDFDTFDFIVNSKNSYGQQ